MSSPLRPPPLTCQLHQVPSEHPFAWVAGRTIPLSPLLCLSAAVCLLQPWWWGSSTRCHPARCHCQQCGRLCPAPLDWTLPCWPSAGPLVPSRGRAPHYGAERLTGAVAANTVQVLYPQPCDPLGQPPAPAAVRSGAGGQSMRHAPANSRPGCRLLRALTLRPACSRALSSPPAGQPPPRPPQPSILLTSKSGCSGSRQSCSCPFSSLLAPFFQGTQGVLCARLLLSPMVHVGAAGHLGVTAWLCSLWIVSPGSRNGMHWGGSGAGGVLTSWLTMDPAHRAG